MVKTPKRWGQRKYIENLWLEYMENPLEEPHSIRQVFYRNLPTIERFVPQGVKENTKDWASVFYSKMCSYLSKLVLRGRASYSVINIIDDSGAKLFVPDTMGVHTGPVLPLQSEYPIEVWVENNSTYNNLTSIFGWEDSKEFCISLVSQRGVASTQEIEKLCVYRDDVEIILNLTDFDPTGNMMPADLQKRVSRIGTPIDVRYIGVFPEHIPEERRIASTMKFKKTDKRTPKFLAKYGKKYPLILQGYGYEIQALMPEEIRELVRSNVNKIVEEFGYEKRERFQEIEEDEEDEL